MALLEVNVDHVEVEGSAADLQNSAQINCDVRLSISHFIKSTWFECTVLFLGFGYLSGGETPHPVVICLVSPVRCSCI